tara:strand:+ start:21455 stop:21637 length:183 start_codon:yes stop_codon:yes gene_type:complete
MSKIVNPYSVKHPQWKHFALGVMVERGQLKAEKVVSWRANSPAAEAFAQGRNAEYLSKIQ